MKKIAAALALPSLFASLLVSCVSDDDVDPAVPTATRGGHMPQYAQDPFGPVPKFRPRTCQDIVDYVPEIPDGEYTLYINQDPTLRWNVYCADMQSAPREYLSLDYENTSMFAPAAGKGSEVVTTYDKIRIDPMRFVIDITDTTFASSTGSATHDGSAVTEMPYAAAMACGGTAAMNINLRGTELRLETSLPFFGTTVSATTDLAADRKALAMTVKGACGWVAPTDKTNPMKMSSQPVLTLAFYNR